MPMISCAECGASVSTNAKTCPGCGVRARHFAAKPKAPPSKRTWLIVVLAGLGLAAILTMSGVVAPPPPADPAADSRARTAYAAALDLKRNLRDPSSLTIDQAMVDDAAETVCLSYRARNGFGGLNREHVTIRAGTASTAPARWNKYCAHKTMNDVTYAARSAL